MEDENKIQSEEAKDKVQPKVKEEPTVTKQIERMRRRINQEVDQRKASEGLNAKLQDQVKTLTEKLKPQDQSKKGRVENPELDETRKENENLKAQLTRRGQIDTTVQQSNKAGIIVFKETLKFVVPSGIDEKRASVSTEALSSFYDDIVKQTKQEFLKGDTPKIAGSDTKPLDRAKVGKISDPVKRVQMIQERIKDYRQEE